jgi:methionyl-tRNA formyltransferase
MRVVFMGTPDFAVPALSALIAAPHIEVAAVLCQPDRPAGRGKKLATGPVKTVAQQHNIPVFQPRTLRLEESRDLRETLKSLRADIFIVAAYGLILPKGILNMPRLGCVNIHGSLLPSYRGAAPIHAAIANGDATTGITIMHMDTGIDTGDMILREELTISSDEYFPSVYARMAQLGAQALMKALPGITAGTAARIAQDDSAASYAPQFTKQDGRINWARHSAQIINHIRAYDEWPGCYTSYDGAVLKIRQARHYSLEHTKPPGTVLISSGMLVVATGDSALEILQIQGAGGKKMPAADYLRGRGIAEGAVLL